MQQNDREAVPPIGYPCRIQLAPFRIRAVLVAVAAVAQFHARDGGSGVGLGARDTPAPAVPSMCLGIALEVAFLSNARHTQHATEWSSRPTV